MSGFQRNPIFQPDLAKKILIAIMIVIENRSQINRTLIFILQSNLDENFFSRL